MPREDVTETYSVESQCIDLLELLESCSISDTHLEGGITVNPKIMLLIY